MPFSTVVKLYKVFAVIVDTISEIFSSVEFSSSFGSYEILKISLIIVIGASILSRSDVARSLVAFFTGDCTTGLVGQGGFGVG